MINMNMDDFFNCFRDMSELSVVLRMVLAVICGGLIGIERGVKRRAAGLRTHMLICVGASITMLTSQFIYLESGYYTDPTRLGAQVIAGVGFIGGGAILTTGQNRIKGLTTAAGLWVCAIIGLACGAGFVECAILATLIVLTAELVLIKVDGLMINSTRKRQYCIEYQEASDLNEILDDLRANRVRVSNLEIMKQNDAVIRATLTLRQRRRKKGKEIHAILSEHSKIQAAEQL